MSKNRIYVSCKSKAQYAEVLKYKARNGHVWRQSQTPVFCSNSNIAEWEKYGTDSVLGIHNEGGVTNTRVALKKGALIGFEEFQDRYNNINTSPTPPSSVYEPRVERPAYKECGCSEPAVKYQDSNINKTTKNNDSMSALKNSFSFDKLSNEEVALSMTGKIAFKSKDGRFKSYDPAQNAILVQSIFPTFNIGKFCYKVPTASNTIIAGDIIFHDNVYKHVVEVTDKGIKSVNLNTGATSNIKREILDGLNMSIVTKVITMFGGQQADGAGAAAFNPMMLAMLAKDGDDFGDGLGDMLPLMLMSQQGGFANGQNPMQQIMMLSALSGKDDLKDSLLPLMMMGGGFGQQPVAGQAANPMQAMLPLMLMSDKKGGNSDLMMMMAMSGGFGGANPFGTPVATPAAAPVASAAGIQEVIPVTEGPAEDGTED